MSPQLSWATIRPCHGALIVSAKVDPSFMAGIATFGMEHHSGSLSIAAQKVSPQATNELMNSKGLPCHALLDLSITLCPKRDCIYLPGLKAAERMLVNSIWIGKCWSE